MILSQTNIDNLLTDLSGKDAGKRTQAERFFEENKAEILPQLADFFIAHRNKTQIINEKQVRWQGIVTFLFSMIIMFTFVIVQKPILKPFDFLLYFAGIFGLAPIVKVWFRREKIHPQYAYVLGLLDELDDPRFVGYILDLMYDGNIHVVEIVEPILYRQLRLLRHTDATLLNDKQRRYLYHLLVIHGTRINGNFNGRKALAILKAIEQIGDMRAFHDVQRVAMAGGSEAVREAAEECLLYIKARRESLERQSTLLRASENTGGQEELLRAANSNADTQAETLLRVPRED